METMQPMKFYRVQQKGRDVGRFYLSPNGTGRLEIDGYTRPLEIVEKVPGEAWGFAIAETDVSRCLQEDIQEEES